MAGRIDFPRTHIDPGGMEIDLFQGTHLHFLLLLTLLLGHRSLLLKWGWSRPDHRQVEYVPKRGPSWATNESTTHDRNQPRERVRKHQCRVGLNCLDCPGFYPQLLSFF